jgi:hypothetical protein
MPAWRLWERIQRFHKQERVKDEEEHKKWILMQLNFARSVTYGLQASQELPPEKPKSKNEKPDWPKINKARKQMEAFIEHHHKGISHPYYFEEYMGLPHAFEKPPAQKVRTSKEFLAEQKVQVSAMEARLTKNLDKIIDKHGDTSFDQLTAPSY